MVLSCQNRPPLIWAGRTDFRRKTCQNRSPRTAFAAKNGPLLPKLVPHGGPILAKIISAKIGSPCTKWQLFPARVHDYMYAAILLSI